MDDNQRLLHPTGLGALTAHDGCTTVARAYSQQF